MSAFKPIQRRLEFNGRTFHFVAYEGQPASIARQREAEPPMWCLMVEGRRCPVVPFEAAQEAEVADRALLRWLKGNIVPAA
jgi:hypothetical protein